MLPGRRQVKNDGITILEFPRFFALVSWATSVTSSTEAGFILLMKRIIKLIKRGGGDFTFLYLKEVLRLSIRFLANQAEHKSKKIIVKLDSTGIPTIIPRNLAAIMRLLRNFLYDEGKSPIIDSMGKYIFIVYPHIRDIVGLLTLLSIFRVFPTKVKPSLKTILIPFGGTMNSLTSKLTIQASLRELIGNFSFKLKSPRLLILESASPTAKKATGESALDAVALGQHPKIFMAFIKYNMRFNGNFGGGLILGAILINLLAFPFLFVIRLVGKIPTYPVGALGVVYDQAGKARVVGITNWGIQTTLRPLHDALFRVLKDVETDGTFNQEKPIVLLMQKFQKESIERVFHSFDLSAATDRLPLQVQIDVLNCIIPSLGDLGGNLLKDIQGKTGYKDKRCIKYAVGQPIGAYSSGAILALTHHVIVKYCAISLGKLNFKDYAVLGDDVVIADSDVANEYKSTIEALGLEINLSKSLESIRFMEFAKKGVGPGGINLSPIGPGLLLRSLRTSFYLAALISELFKLDLIKDLTEVINRLFRLTKKIKFFKNEFQNSSWAAFGLRSIFTRAKSFSQEVLRQHDGATIVATIGWYFANILTRVESNRPSVLPLDLEDNTRVTSKFFIHDVFNTLVELKYNKWMNARNQLITEIKFFLKNFGKINQSKSRRPLEVFMASSLKFVSPSFFAYILSFYHSGKKLSVKPTGPKEASGKVIQEIAEADIPSVASIDGKDEKLMLEAKALGKEFETLFVAQGPNLETWDPEVFNDMKAWLHNGGEFLTYDEICGDLPHKGQIGLVNSYLTRYAKRQAQLNKMNAILCKWIEDNIGEKNLPEFVFNYLGRITNIIILWSNRRVYFARLQILLSKLLSYLLDLGKPKVFIVPKYDRGKRLYTSKIKKTSRHSRKRPLKMVSRKRKIGLTSGFPFSRILKQHK